MGKNRVEVKAIQQRLAADEVDSRIRPHRTAILLHGHQPRRSSSWCRFRSRKQIEPLVDRFTEEVRSGKAGRSPVAKELYDAVLRPVAQWQTDEADVRRAGREAAPPAIRLAFEPEREPRHTSSRSCRRRTSGTCFEPDRAGRLPERPLLAMGGVPYDRMFARNADD